jgi:hypothetical protein
MFYNKIINLAHSIDNRFIDSFLNLGLHGIDMLDKMPNIKDATNVYYAILRGLFIQYYLTKIIFGY